MKIINKNNIRNISNEEFAAIKSLQNNWNIIISRAGKATAIIVIDKEDYTEKIQNMLKLKQFRNTNKSLRKKEINQHFRELHVGI